MRLDLWLAAPLDHALGRALEHFLWQGAVLAAALRAALFLARERSARWRHRAAAACLLAMPLAFGITLSLSLGTGSSIEVMPPAAPRMVFSPVISQGTPAAPADWLAWLAPLWVSGVIVFYALRLAGWVRVDRMRRRGVCAAPEEWRRRLRSLARAVRVSQPVELLESCLAGVPLVIGYWRPVILMPLGALAGLSAEQVEAILIHELAHIRRADYLVSLAQSAIEGLFFFHPAVWWIGAVVRAEREYACDDVVMALRPDARAYAAALTTLEQCRPPAIQPAAAANGGDLVRRIRRLLGDPAPARVPVARSWALAGVLMLLVTVALALTVWPPARSFAQQPTPAQSAADKQEAAQRIEKARRNIDELERRLAGKEKAMQEAAQGLEHAQELLQRDAGELDRALRNGGGHSDEFARAEEQLRKAQEALKELVAAGQAGESRKLLADRQTAMLLQQLEPAQSGESQKLDDEQRLAALLDQLTAGQAGKSQELLQQQERALQRAAEQVHEITNGKLDELLRQQQRQMALADQALQKARAANGGQSLREIEKQLQQAEQELDRAVRFRGQGNDSLRAQSEPPETRQPQSAAEPGFAYEKWLKEDVAYIITAEERRDFLALKTGTERDRFIENFWLRRDPPGSGPNAFKQEYYRRIAYANEHFASSAPGWKTDRGRTYIVYGPPDEIEDHKTETTPRQTWLYHYIAGVGADVVVGFTDPGKTGDFRMTADPPPHGSCWLITVKAPEEAQAVVQSLRAKGFPAFAGHSGFGGGAYRDGTFFYVNPSPKQVLVGPYPDEAWFAKAKAALEAAGFHPVRAQ